MKRSIMQDQWYASANAKQWAMGILNEGNMLVNISKEFEKFFDLSDLLPRRDELDKLRILQFTNETFFVIALNKLIKWLDRIDNAEATRIVNEFEAKFTLYKNVRNMREHDVEYYFGEKLYPYIDFTDCTLNAGAKVKITIKRSW